MRIPGFSAAAVVLCASATGCAAQSPAYQKKLADLSDRVLILQNERDRLEERLTAVEEQQRRLLAQRQPAPEVLTRPPLKTVVLRPTPQDSSGEGLDSARPPAPDPEAADAELVESTGRPVLSGEGKQLRVTGGQP